MPHRTGPRLWQLDALRGLALVNMVAYHALYDWVYVFGLPCAWYDISAPGCHIWQQYICWSFLLIAGFSFTLSRAPLKNGLLTLGCAAVRSIQQGIADAYLADMTKYASPLDSSKILNVWRSVPEQLAKENHKFQYATIASSARAFQYGAPINWLHAAGLVSFCYRVSEGRKPLRAFAQHDFFKLYVLDVGFLTMLQGLDASDLEPASDKGSRFRGGVAENYVMQQLRASGVEPFYWGTASKAEVDFVVQLEGEGAIPIEVKSGANVSARSLEAYRKAYDPPVVLRLSTKNFGFERGIKSVPLYAAHCIGRR